MARENTKHAGPGGRRIPFSFAVFLARGFNVGLIPFAPGTWGSVVGLGWSALLMFPGNAWVFLLGTLAGVGASVWICGAAEKILQQKDPGSIVLDEIAALPLCFLGWQATAYFKTGNFTSASALFRSESLLEIVLLFAAFRFFDVVKPWPIRQSQALSGGWGVTADDCLAALFTAAVSLLFVP